MEARDDGAAAGLPGLEVRWDQALACGTRGGEAVTALRPSLAPASAALQRRRAAVPDVADRARWWREDAAGGAWTERRKPAVQRGDVGATDSSGEGNAPMMGSRISARMPLSKLRLAVRSTCCGRQTHARAESSPGGAAGPRTHARFLPGKCRRRHRLSGGFHALRTHLHHHRVREDHERLRTEAQLVDAAGLVEVVLEGEEQRTPDEVVQSTLFGRRSGFSALGCLSSRSGERSAVPVGAAVKQRRGAHVSSDGVVAGALWMEGEGARLSNGGAVGGGGVAVCLEDVGDPEAGHIARAHLQGQRASAETAG